MKATEREILSDSIERIVHGGKLLRDELDKLTIEELDGVLRTFVRIEQRQRVADYLAARATPIQLKEAA